MPVEVQATSINDDHIHHSDFNSVRAMPFQAEIRDKAEKTKERIYYKGQSGKKQERIYYERLEEARQRSSFPWELYRSRKQKRIQEDSIRDST